MKIAVIGSGNRGKNLVKNFANLGVLVAVADAVRRIWTGWLKSIQRWFDTSLRTIY